MVSAEYGPVTNTLAYWAHLRVYIHRSFTQKYYTLEETFSKDEPAYLSTLLVTKLEIL
jgi:hypothetical protein